MPLSPERIERVFRIKQATSVNFQAEGFKGELLSYQAQGAAFLVMAERGLVLYFVGAGKTPISIAADCKLRALNKVRRTLVIGTSNGRYHWEPEYRKFTDLNVRVIDGTRAERVHQWHDAQWADVTVTHYETLRSDIQVVENLRFDLVIYDEAHIFKSEKTQLAESIRRLMKIPTYVFCLTATAIQKKIEDLYWIMEKVDPAVLGDFREFEDMFLIKELQSIRRRKFWKVTGYRNVDVLQRMMSPYYILKRQEDVPEIERKRVRILRPITLSTEERTAYHDLKSGIHPDLTNRADVLERFRRMEQLCSTMAFSYYNGEPRKATGLATIGSSKIADILQLLQGELAEEKVVVFSKFKLPLYHLQQVLDAHDIKWVMLSGDEPDAKVRESQRAAFIDDPTIQVCLITQVAEASINLHAARYTVFLNEIWNPARQEQIIGRIDRPFLQKSKIVTSIHFSCVGTFENALHERMRQQADLAKQVLGSGSIVEEMSSEELFSLIKSGDL